MAHKGSRITGTFDAGRDSAFKGIVHVKKNEIPGGILSVIGRATVPSDGEWHEVSPWGSCKLVARKRGAVMQYGHQHYGYYDCCMKTTVELQGEQTYGISRRTMPTWMGLNFDAVMCENFMDPKVMRLLSWTRDSVSFAHAFVEDPEGWRYNINLRRENFLVCGEGQWPDLVGHCDDRRSTAELAYA